MIYQGKNKPVRPPNSNKHLRYNSNDHYTTSMGLHSLLQNK